MAEIDDIEQAKGVVAERWNIDMVEAFGRIRTYARNHNLQITVVAKQIIDDQLDLDANPSIARRR